MDTIEHHPLWADYEEFARRALTADLSDSERYAVASVLRGLARLLTAGVPEDEESEEIEWYDPHTPIVCYSDDEELNEEIEQALAGLSTDDPMVYELGTRIASQTDRDAGDIYDWLDSIGIASIWHDYLGPAVDKASADYLRALEADE